MSVGVSAERDGVAQRVLEGVGVEERYERLGHAARACGVEFVAASYLADGAAQVVAEFTQRSTVYLVLGLSRAREEYRRGDGRRALYALWVVVARFGAFLSLGEDFVERVEGPRDGGDAHRGAVAEAFALFLLVGEGTI